MTKPRDESMGGDFAALLRGVDGPRPLPASLRAELEDVLAADGGVVAALASGVDRPAAVPADLRDRLEATLAGAGVGAGRGGVLPTRLQRRLVRVLPGAGAGAGTAASGGGGWRRFGTETTLMRVVAVAAAVLLVCGVAVAAIEGGPENRTPMGPVAAPAPDVAATVPPETTPPPVETTTTAKPRRPRATQPAPAKALVAYTSCDDLLAKTKEQVLAVVGPYGLPADSDGGGRQTVVVAAPATGSSGGGSAASAPPEAEELFSSTNVQEQGVDEPDIVKTDGRRIVTVGGSTLRVTARDRASGGLSPAGALALPAGASNPEVLLQGDRAVVLAQTADPRTAQPVQPSTTTEASPGTGPVAASSPYQPNDQWSVAWVVDLADPAAMRIVSTLYLEGTYRTARLANGRVRLVVGTDGLGPAFERPADGTEAAKEAAAARNRELVAASTLDDWTPHYLLLDGTDMATGRSGRLCACDDVLRPKEFGGVATISVITIDPANPQPDKASSPGTAVQGSAKTVYASANNLYVTSHPVVAPPPAGQPQPPVSQTEIHRFDILGTEPAKYAGSGIVRGEPINQWALSERNGRLRVATTERRITVAPPPQAWTTETESFVTVMAVGPTSLDQVGQVGGLGRGEQIFGVRFVDDIGYVVTFRRADPLYIVDLSDPGQPRVRGELKVSGYSAYLHPLAAGYLLGVGQEATDAGVKTGSQVSTFDVQNPEQPTQVDRLGLGQDANSAVENDHRAFLYWQATRTAVIPFTRWVPSTGQSPGRNEAGVVAVKVGDDYKLREVGRLTHDGRSQSQPAGAMALVRRSFVIGDTLFTLSDTGLLASDLATLADRQWLGF